MQYNKNNTLNLSNIVPQYSDTYHNWCLYLQKEICDSLEAIESSNEVELFQRNNKHLQLFKPQKFNYKNWNYHQNGSGLMSILQDGIIFEKAGVNVSCVWGQFDEEFAKNLPYKSSDNSFWACGISLVIHPRNPYVPIVHMNTRHIVTSKAWFGGGSDLTPCIEFKEDTSDFHNEFKIACNKHNANYYEKFKKECDEYFYIKHRQEPRGVGGIFYDYLNTGDFEKDFAFNKDVGLAFLNIYPQIVKRRMLTNWNSDELEMLYKKRSRYVEFNLVYDRGTQFGLKTNGNIDAILMSMPPVAKWRA